MKIKSRIARKWKLIPTLSNFKQGSSASREVQIHQSDSEIKRIYSLTLKWETHNFIYMKRMTIFILILKVRL